MNHSLGDSLVIYKNGKMFSKTICGIEAPSKQVKTSWFHKKPKGKLLVECPRCLEKMPEIIKAKLSASECADKGD